MKFARKPFEAGSAFPFDYDYRQRKNMKTELPDHLHDWHEIVYVHEGKGTFFIDQTLYDMRSGSLFLIPGNTIHQAFPDPEEPVTTTAVFFSTSLVQVPQLDGQFSYLSCLQHAKKYKSYKYEPPASEQSAMEQLLDDMALERKQEQQGYRQAMLLLLERLLLQLGRSIVPPGEAGAASAAVIGPPWIRDILRHIDEQPEASLPLTSLAERASVTPAHFSRVFKQLTGMNVTDYVTTKRIIRAKELLRAESDSGIREIAERCGFETLPHFHRMFKKLTGTTPAAYKKSAPPH
ncbi:AraC family transcriptional regulator [Paenibacillus protaetiae]|uniref:AraC family transcriptional regulator n=1 Tax=Paenibacillus protaetiae TaxID=2509456 RepID=A0A4V0YF95_9BACL|nr:AraC family transcriptional regulator [Paenibacillus protaetiae]QAY66931.1 AraC family transcriptional regulator [Paenibacillus protaetiae]